MMFNIQSNFNEQKLYLPNSPGRPGMCGTGGAAVHLCKTFESYFRGVRKASF